MLKIPAKSLFEGEDSYIKKLTDFFESKMRLDPINAFYTAQFLVKSRALKMGDYRKGNGPEQVLLAVKRIINQSGDVTRPGNIKEMLDSMQKH